MLILDVELWFDVFVIAEVVVKVERKNVSWGFLFLDSCINSETFL